MERKSAFASLLANAIVATIVFASFPAAADTAGRPDDGTPDEVYEEVVGPDYPEDKDEGTSGMMAGGGAVSAMMGGGIQFPFEAFNWTVYSWASTNNGLRFYGVYYKDELILYDYRVPWVRVNGNLRSLTMFNLVQGPDLWIYQSGMFLVKARYNLGNPNIDVTTVTRFYGNGTMEPWVLVDTHNAPINLKVGQRFDFDLGEAADDTQQYFDGVIWRMTIGESAVLDSTYQANGSGYQWRDFDSDQSGGSYVLDQEAGIRPYSSDDSKWYMLRWCAGEIGGDPAGYLNGQTINGYVPGQADPWIGSDAVNWYVSNYVGTTLAYPGPWVRVLV